MRSKKLLALLLTLCMMLSCLAPVAAATPSESSVTRPMHGTSTTVSETVGADGGTVSNTVNDGVVTGSESVGIPDAESEETGAALTGNAWTITPIDDAPEGLSDLLGNNSDTLHELESLESVYDADAQVTVFVVLEDEPLAAVYSSPSMASDSAVQAFAQKQADVVSAIHAEIDSTAQVITQFNYLTNSVVLSTEYRNLSKIAALDGVASVFVTPIFYPAVVTEEADKMTVSSGQMTNVDDVWNLNNSGYTGAGMTIAVLDTGIDLDHPSFESDPAGAVWTQEYVQEMIDTYGDTLHAVKKRASLSSDYVYYSAKIPFIFNYALGNNNVGHNDTIGDHGTHVSGIAAANAVEGTGVVGMAPDAQIIAMKVFNPTTGGATLYDYVNALEDCLTMGVDVVNLSLGSVAGFSETGKAEVDAIFERIAESNTIVNIAAGNEGTSAQGSQYGEAKALTSSIDNATISSPATYANAMAVASVSNNYVMSDYISVGGEKIFYQPTVELLYGYTDIGLQELYAGETFEYAIVDGFGVEEDFYDEAGNSLVAGKIAVVNRGGDVYFADKANNAADAGAVAVIVCNNSEEDIFTFGMTTSYDGYDSGEYSDIPAILISRADGEKMAEIEDKHLTVPTDAALRIDSKGGQMSSFSSWGVSADLRLLPDLSGIGGNVYSCYDDGTYGLMSGTSMATPQVCGVTALVKQYLKANNMDDRDVVEALLMSTANPVISDDSDLPASPRQQGAGLVDALKAVTSEAYLTVDDGRPKAELGDDANGSFEFTFEIHNFGDEAKTYTLSSDLLCEDFVKSAYYKGVELMAGWDTKLDGTVSFDAKDNTVTVPAGQTVEVEVSIDVSSDGLAWIAEHFENGNYVEGYIYLTDTAKEGGVDMSLPFMGFCGDWTEAPIFDSGYWYDNSYWLNVETDGVDEDSPITAEEYWHVPWVSMGVSVNDWLLGLNPFSGVQVDEDGNVRHSDENNVISPNGDGFMDKISDFYLSLMRNARYMWVRYVDEDGDDLCEPISLIYESKTMLNSSYGQVMPFAYSWYYTAPLYDFADCEDGDTVYLTIDAMVDYDLGDKVYCVDEKTGEMMLVDGVEADDTLVIPISIDTTKPTLTGVVESTKDGKRYLTVTVNEAHPATVALMNPTGTQVYDQVFDNEMTKIGENTYTAMLDITGRGDEFMIAAGDYGYNISEAIVKRQSGDDNSPAMDKTALYAYQVYDLGIYYSYGWDYMFGWTTVDTDPASETMVTMINSDANEYYAINAAEYVDGRIFAVDAGNNFLYMQPGLWNRTTICNLGYNVIDMAFDDESGTMYVLISDAAEDYFDEDVYAIATLDLLTGELNILHNWGVSDSGSGGGGGIYFPPVASYADDGIASDDDYAYVNPGKYDMPWAMTFADDGYLYCCKFDQPGLYWLDFDAWELIPVMDDDYEDVIPALSSGFEIAPYYAQSMTYSKADGKLYWLFCDSSNASMLVTFDPADNWSYTLKGLGYTEYVGALTLEDTDYKLLTSDEVTDLALNETEVTLAVGDTEQLTVYTLPWNAPAAEIEWSVEYQECADLDSKADVVTVENGLITAVSAGTAIVSATCGDAYAECYVTVLQIGDGFRAFNFSGDGDYGTWQDIDLSTMHGTDVFPAGDEESTVYFAAADYNGHDGYIYGYDANNYNAYKVNATTGEVTKLKGSSTDVCDMAYDYSRGIMFAIIYSDGNSDTALYAMNMRTGELVPYANLNGLDLRTLACDMAGVLYAIDTDGTLYMIELTESDETGGGGGIVFPPIVDPVDPLDEPGIDPGFGVEGDDTDYPMVAEPMPIMELPYNGEQDLGQSMCYDHNDLYGETLYWCNTNLSAFYQIDLVNLIAYNLGTVDSHIYPQYLGMHVVPEDEAPELEPVEVSSIKVETPFLLVGDSTELEIDVEPLNANQPYTIVYDGVFSIPEDDSEDDVVVVNDETGVITALKPGRAYVSLYVDGKMEETYTCIEIFVKNPTTSRIRAYDYLNGYWLGVDQHDPANDTGVYGTVRYDGSTYLLTAAEYVGTNGLIYGYVTDNAYFEPEEFFAVFNGSTLSVKSMTKLGSEFPTVYDMAYDYANGVMYALAGTSNVISLYYVDLETGALIKLCSADELGHTFLNITVDADGNLYGMTNGTAELYLIDLENGVSKYAEVYTDVSNPYKSSLAYDYDTGYFYWTPYDSFYLIDLNDYSCNRVGMLSGEVYGLMLMAKKDDYPTMPTELTAAAITSDLVELTKGADAQLSYLAWPSDAEVREAVWSSDDESVATVDQNGKVTGVGSGHATVTVTLNGTVSASCTVIVYGKNDTYLTYNVTDKGFSAIDRTDPSKVTNLTANETEAAVSAMVVIDDVIYAYDEEGNFFTTTVESGFKRTYLGSHGIDVSEYDGRVEDISQKSVYTTDLIVRDMTVLDDGRIVALGVITWNVHSEYYYNGVMYHSSDWVGEPAGIGGSSRLYEVNPETGAMTELCAILDSSGNDYMSGGNMLQAGSKGRVYVYNTMNDRIALVDINSGYTTAMASLQGISLQGEPYKTMGMTYDATADCLYLLVTTNGYYYRLFRLDVGTGLLRELGNVGSVSYNDEEWHNEGDIFHGLIIRNGGDAEDNTPVNPVTPSKPSNPSTPSEPEKNTLPFVDVAEGTWYYDAVKYVYDKGLMNGVGDGTHFAPDGDVTRAMVVQTLYRMAGSPAVSGSNGFTDLSNDWYLDAVQWAYTNGITTGRTETSFAPDELVTREELATFFYRYAAFCGRDVSASADLSGFVDVADLGDWALPAMSWANAEQLIRGRDGNALAPKSTAARSELATILMRFCEK